MCKQNLFSSQKNHLVGGQNVTDPGTLEPSTLTTKLKLKKKKVVFTNYIYSVGTTPRCHKNLFVLASRHFWTGLFSLFSFRILPPPPSRLFFLPTSSK